MDIFTPKSWLGQKIPINMQKNEYQLRGLQLESCRMFKHKIMKLGRSIYWMGRLNWPIIKIWIKIFRQREIYVKEVWTLTALVGNWLVVELPPLTWLLSSNHCLATLTFYQVSSPTRLPYSNTKRTEKYCIALCYNLPRCFSDLPFKSYKI